MHRFRFVGWASVPERPLTEESRDLSCLAGGDQNARALTRPGPPITRRRETLVG
jgi:hypothetical protein